MLTFRSSRSLTASASVRAPCSSRGAGKLLVAVCALALSACGSPSAPGDRGPVPSTSVVEVTDPSARSCELLLSTAQQAEAQVGVEETALLEWEQWPGKLAVAFTARADQALGAVATLTITSATDPEVESARCFDGRGNELASQAIAVR